MNDLLTIVCWPSHLLVTLMPWHQTKDRGAALLSFNVLCVMSIKLNLAIEMMTAERSWWEVSQRGNLFQMKDRTCQYYSPSPLSPLHKHTHTFLSMSPVTFSLHPPVASSLSSEPLPLRSDRGQHFSILQHTVCTLTDALTHTTSTLTLGCHSTILNWFGEYTTSRLV